MVDCYIYIIKSTSGHYKIGHSKRPERRLDQLQKTQGPFEYSLINWFGIGDKEAAMNLEFFLHDLFKDKRVRGEWFTLAEKDLTRIGFLAGASAVMFQTHGQDK